MAILVWSPNLSPIQASLIRSPKPDILFGSLPGNSSLFSGRLLGNSGLFSGRGEEDEGGFSMGARLKNNKIIIIIIIINGLFQVINNRVFGYKQSQTVYKLPSPLLS